jgi:hypothetical protein
MWPVIACEDCRLALLHPVVQDGVHGFIHPSTLFLHADVIKGAECLVEQARRKDSVYIREPKPAEPD